MRQRSSLPSPERRAELRKAAGFSLQDVADVVGVTRGAVWNWERGRQPADEYLAAYLDVLKVFGEAA